MDHDYCFSLTLDKLPNFITILSSLVKEEKREKGGKVKRREEVKDYIIESSDSNLPVLNKQSGA